jgi:hypothetical protein
VLDQLVQTLLAGPPADSDLPALPAGSGPREP